MTSEFLAMVAGVIVSLGLAYVPPFKSWYEPLTSAQKVTVLGAVLLIVAIGVVASSCLGIYSYMACDQAGILGVVEALIQALLAAGVTSQATYVAAVRPFKRT